MGLSLLIEVVPATLRMLFSNPISQPCSKQPCSTQWCARSCILGTNCSENFLKFFALIPSSPGEASQCNRSNADWTISSVRGRNRALAILLKLGGGGNEFRNSVHSTSFLIPGTDTPSQYCRSDSAIPNGLSRILPPPCISYANVHNYYGPCAYCRLDKGVACTQHIQLLTYTCTGCMC